MVECQHNSVSTLLIRLKRLYFNLLRCVYLVEYQNVQELHETSEINNKSIAQFILLHHMFYVFYILYFMYIRLLRICMMKKKI